MEDLFKNKKYNTESLKKYGFEKIKDKYSLKKDLAEGEFCLTVTIDKLGKINTQVTEKATNEPYTLHLIEGVKGAFVGKIRECYINILEDISKKCFENDIFKTSQAKEILKYAKDKYGDLPEYLWEKFPDNAVCRRKDNKKWYFAILTTKAKSLGLEGDESIEIIDLRANPHELPNIIKQEGYYAGYHMNKKHWISIILDDYIPTDEIFQRIDDSYKLADKK